MVDGDAFLKAVKIAPSSARSSVGGATTTTTATDKMERSRRRAVIGVRYKTKHCHSFMETGECRYGDSCVFAHGDEEMTKYLAIAEAAMEGSCSSNNSCGAHFPASKFPIPLPASAEHLAASKHGGSTNVRSPNVWFQSGYPGALAALIDADREREAKLDANVRRDYGFGMSAEEERRRALDGNRRVPTEELERHRLQRKADAIARVSALANAFAAQHPTDTEWAAEDAYNYHYGPYVGNREGKLHPYGWYDWYDGADHYGDEGVTENSTSISDTGFRAISSSLTFSASTVDCSASTNIPCASPTIAPEQGACDEKGGTASVSASTSFMRPNSPHQKNNNTCSAPHRTTPSSSSTTYTHNPYML